MTTILILAALCLSPLAEPVEDRCDAIIRESFYDESGRLVFVQDIFIDETEYPASYLVSEIVAWRLVRQPDQIVHRDADGGWFILWNDGGKMRRVSARSYAETHSQIDSEVAMREVFTVKHRRGLRGEKP